MLYWWVWSCILCWEEDEYSLFTGNYVHEYSFHLQLVSVIVGKFAGWLMYPPALPNCMSMFHNSTGGLSTTSLTLHDFVFPVAWFLCEGTVHNAQYGQFNIQASISGPIFLAACFWSTLLPILKDGGSLAVVFWAVLKWFSSRVFLAIDRARWCALKLSSPDSGSPRNHSISSRSWCKGKLGSLP